MIDRRWFVPAVIRISFEASGGDAPSVIARYDVSDGLRNIIKTGLKLVWFDDDAKAGNLRRGEAMPPLYIFVHYIDDRHREIPSDHAVSPRRISDPENTGPSKIVNN
jgi:hypothetical protein